MEARIQSLATMLRNGERVMRTAPKGTHIDADWIAYFQDIVTAAEIVHAEGYTIIRSYFLGQNYLRAEKAS